MTNKYPRFGVTKGDEKGVAIAADKLRAIARIHIGQKYSPDFLEVADAFCGVRSAR